MAATKLEEYGGSKWDCFSDMGVCLYTCCCAQCALSEALERAGEGSCIGNCASARHLVGRPRCWH